MKKSFVTQHLFVQGFLLAEDFVVDNFAFAFIAFGIIYIDFKSLPITEVYIIKEQFLEVPFGED